MIRAIPCYTRTLRQRFELSARWDERIVGYVAIHHKSPVIEGLGPHETKGDPQG